MRDRDPLETPRAGDVLEGIGPSGPGQARVERVGPFLVDVTRVVDGVDLDTVRIPLALWAAECRRRQARVLRRGS